MTTQKGHSELNYLRDQQHKCKDQISKSYSLSYDCKPLNPEDYNQKVFETLDSMKLITPNDKDLNLYDELILGRIEGQSTSANFKQIIEEIVGQISEEKLKGYLKEKTEQRNFGTSNKDKNCCIREVKKIQSLQKYFDIQEISKKRKYNKLCSAMIKSLLKYLELYSKAVQEDWPSIEKAFEQYHNYIKEEKKFKQFAEEQTQSNNVVEKIPEIEENQQIFEEVKNQQNPEVVNGIVSEVGLAQSQENKKKNQEEKKVSEPDNKTPKKAKGKKKEQKNETQVNPEVNSADATDKEKGEIFEKEKNEKDEKEAKEKEKTVKKPTNKLLTEFFGFKKEKNVEAIKKPLFQQSEKAIEVEKGEQKDIISEKLNEDKIIKPIWDRFGQNPEEFIEGSLHEITSLRQQFKAYRMQNEGYNPEPHYTNIIMTLSTIEYYDYMMQVDRQVDFRDPFKKIRNVMYFEDESEEFEGESADEEVEEEDQEEEDELSEGNHTILSDDHLSNEELSSCEVNDLQLKIEYGKGKKWVVNFVSRSMFAYTEDELEVCKTFSMISLETDTDGPLRLDEEEESVQFNMTPQIWRDIYKLAHGYYGTKEAIIKDLSGLLPGLSKNWIDSMLRERSQKVLNQRFIKKDFIDDIKEKIPEIDSLLEQVLEERNEELRKIKAEKNQEKDLKLEKDILECTGSRYIINLVKQLKEKGYKQMRRNQLIEFINERKGEEWDQIKAQMNTMSRPIEEMIRNMPPASQKIYPQQILDDQTYKKIICTEEKPYCENNSNSTIKDENTERVEKQKKSKLKQRKNNKKMEKQSGKRKKQTNKDKHPGNIYEKTKPISRARKTKNSLKTGIPSIEELKKIKAHQKASEQDEKIENEQEQGKESELDNQGESQNQREERKEKGGNDQGSEQQISEEQGNEEQENGQEPNNNEKEKSVNCGQRERRQGREGGEVGEGKEEATALKGEKREMLTVSNIENQ